MRAVRSEPLTAPHLSGARETMKRTRHTFILKTIIMTMRRTAVHPRRGGLKLYFSGLVTAYTTRRESMMTFTSHAAGPPRKALNHERPYRSARQHGLLSGGRIFWQLLGAHATLANAEGVVCTAEAGDRLQGQEDRGNDEPGLTDGRYGIHY